MISLFLKKIILFFFLLLLISCQKSRTEEHFEGYIETYSITKETALLKPEKLYLDSMCSGNFAVYDSILIFYDYRYRDYFFRVFNAKTQKFIGVFSPIGRGNNEISGFAQGFQFYTEGNDLKTILFAPNESSMLVWNITQSLSKKKTIYDQVIKYQWRNEHSNAYTYLVKIGNDSILAYISGSHQSKTEEITLPYYQIRNLTANKPINNISIFRNPIQNDKSKVIMPETFFESHSHIHPDGDKIAQAMFWLPQINIVDIPSGKVKGYRTEGGENFSLFSTNMQQAKYYFHRIQANKNYIFALWSGTSPEELTRETAFDTIHVFNWNGKMVKQIKLEKPIHEFGLDVVNNFLYGYNTETEEFYRYKVNDAGL